MARTARLLFLLVALGLSAGCERARRQGETQPAAFVSVPPLAFLVDRIGDERFSTRVLIAPGQDPHTFEPTPRQVVDLGRSRVFFRIGIPLEDRVLEKVQKARGLAVIDAGKGIERVPLEDEHEEIEAGDDRGHGHLGHDESLDPHVWLSPPLLLIMADNVRDGLIQVDPEGAETFRRNAEALKAEINATHQRLGQELGPYRGRSFFVFHAAFGYFARTYGLHQRAVQVEGKTPSPRQLADLIERARAEGVKVIFVQPQFDPRAARTVADAIGGVVAPLDPLERDCLANLGRLGSELAAGWSGTTPGADRGAATKGGDR